MINMIFDGEDPPDFVGFFGDIDLFEWFLIFLNIFFMMLYWFHLVSKYPIIFVRSYLDKDLRIDKDSNKDRKIGRLLYSYRSEKMRSYYILVFKHGGKTFKYYCKENSESFLEAKYSTKYQMYWEFPDYQEIEMEVNPFPKQVVKDGAWNKFKYGMAVFFSTVIPLVMVFKGTRKWFEMCDSIVEGCVNELCENYGVKVDKPKKVDHICPLCKEELSMFQEIDDKVRILQLKMTKSKITTICTAVFLRKVIDDEEGEVEQQDVLRGVPILKLEDLYNDESVVEDSVRVVSSDTSLTPIYDLQEGYDYDISMEELKSTYSIRMNNLAMFMEEVEQENEGLRMKLRLAKNKFRQELKEAVHKIQEESVLGIGSLADYTAELLKSIGSGATVKGAVNEAVAKYLKADSGNEIVDLKINLGQFEKENEMLKQQIRQMNSYIRSKQDMINLRVNGEEVEEGGN